MGRLLNLALSVDTEKGEPPERTKPLSLVSSADDVAISEKNAELTRLVGIVAKHHGFSPEDTAEAVHAAKRDIDGWLVEFRLLAAEIPTAPEPNRDDRITCRQCAELTSNGRCLAARDGRMKDVMRDYSPVSDVLLRCEFFRPKTETEH
jgi:hypothetical protein